MDEPWKDLAKTLKNTKFVESFLDSYIRNGYGSLPKREIDLLILNLLIENIPTWKSNRPSNYELSRQLRISPRRIQSTLDELSYRDAKKDDAWCKKQLKEILKKAEKIEDKEIVRFQIDDGLVRDYATMLIRRSYGIVDTSFNTSIIKLSAEKFSFLALTVADEKDSKKFLRGIPRLKEYQDHQKSKKPFRLFVDSFAKAAGEQAGKKLINLGFTVLTGGIPDAIEIVKSIAGAE